MESVTTRFLISRKYRETWASSELIAVTLLWYRDLSAPVSVLRFYYDLLQAVVREKRECSRPIAI